MKAVALKAFPRALTRRNGTKRLRATGRIPAVIYGARREKPANLEVDSKQLRDLLLHSASENLLVNLAVEGDAQQYLALLQEIQHHPLSGKFLHLDLHEVAEDEMVTLLVPVETIGEPVGVKTGGGVLEHILHKIKVRAKPADLPEVITVNVASMEIGKSIHLGEIVPPAGTEILGEKSVVVISVAAPVTEAEEAAATEATAAATPAEPEMIKEKKDEAGGEEAAKGAKPAAAKAGDKAGDKAAKPAEKAGEKPAAAKPAEKKK